MLAWCSIISLTAVSLFRWTACGMAYKQLLMAIFNNRIPERRSSALAASAHLDLSSGILCLLTPEIQILTLSQFKYRLKNCLYCTAYYISSVLCLHITQGRGLWNGNGQGAGCREWEWTMGIAGLSYSYKKIKDFTVIILLFTMSIYI